MRTKKMTQKLTWLRRQKNNNAYCRYCGTVKGLTKDHIIPKSRGGKNSKNNYQVLCEFCNKNKSNLTDFEVAATFRAIKERGVWYVWEEKFERWLIYIEQTRDEYKRPPLNWG